MFWIFLPSLICLAVSVAFAFIGISGWGWFLLIAVLLYPTMETD